MTLPIDPAAMDPEDYGEEQAVLEMDHEAAVEHTREAFEAAGFGMAVEFSVSELLNEKVDADRDPYHVLGACNPDIADRALDHCLELGGLMPCNVVVVQEEPGRQRVYHLSIMRVARLLGLADDDDAWQAIVDETGEYIARAFENLDARGTAG